MSVNVFCPAVGGYRLVWVAGNIAPDMACLAALPSSSAMIVGMGSHHHGHLKLRLPVCPGHALLVDNQEDHIENCGNRFHNCLGDPRLNKKRAVEWDLSPGHSIPSLGWWHCVEGCLCINVAEVCSPRHWLVLNIEEHVCVDKDRLGCLIEAQECKVLNHPP
eukprot:2626359-Ditylum_brightwellii.AAC.1